jgi:AraC family transcriptional regulator, regulatory protein of adaptative response / DNA-3-methyladenine glycosylase II
LETNIKAYENARLSKDKRFDGKFFTGVHSTGIFCRPICPAPNPKRENIEYFDSAASAMEAGLRPCLRCRPESAPDSPVWKGVSASLERALYYIKNGYLNNHSVTDLAEVLGFGDRQLRRLFREKLGCSPKMVANTERLFFGKRLLQDSTIPISQIAYAAGFNSLRRFNDAFKKTYNKTPSGIRKKSEEKGTDKLSIFLAYREPFHFNELLTFFRARAVPDIEKITDDSYERSFKINDMLGSFVVSNDFKNNRLIVDIKANNCNQLYELNKQIRRMFDLDTDLEIIEKQFYNDKVLGELVKKYSIQRLPGCWDSFEFSIRAILGQVVSVKAATTFCKRFVEKHGKQNPNSSFLRFPEADELLGEDFLSIGLSKAKNESIKSLVQVYANKNLNDYFFKDLNELTLYLEKIKGIGAWTANYIAMRGFSEPDAFPYNDLGVIKGIGKYDRNIKEKEIIQLSKKWQPWRSYATMLLWKSLEGEN